MRSPLRKRVLRELAGEWHKYLTVFLFLTLIIGFISGMYVANDSMLKSHDMGVTEYKLEYGHFRLKDKADEELIAALEKGEQADLRTYYRDKAINEATDEAVKEIEKALKDSGLEPEGLTADLYKENYDKALEEAKTKIEEEVDKELNKELEGKLPDPAEPVPVKIYENFYKEVSEDKDCDNVSDSDMRVYVMQDKVNGYSLHEGTEPKDETEIAIDRMHASNAGIEVGDTIRVGGVDFKVSALIALVNYSCLYKDNSDTMFDAITFDVAVVTGEGFDRLKGRTFYNYAWDYVERPANEKQEKKLADDYLSVVGTQAVVAENEVEDYLPRYASQAINFATNDFSKDKTMGGIILDILVVVLAFIFAVTISNTIAKEASVIGTLRASGYTRGELVVHYMTAPVIVTLIAAVIGNLLGYTLFKNVVVAMYYNSYSLPTYTTYVNFEALWKTTLIPVVLMFVINLIIISRKLTLSPLRFLRHDLKRSKRKKAVRLPRWKFMARFKTRVLMQNFPNYLILLLGVCFVMVMMAMAVGMPSTLKHYQDHVGDMLFANEQLVLTDTEDEDGNEITTASKGAEKFSMTSLVYKSKIDESVNVYGMVEDSAYMKIPADLKDHEVVISSAFNGKYHFEPGDTVTLEEKYENRSYTFTVKGIVDYDGAIAVFMNNDSFNRIFEHEEGSFSGYFSDETITDIDEDYVAMRITSKDIIKMADQLDHSMGSMMLYFQYMCIVLSIVLIYLLTKIIIEKNENAISMTKILGYNNKEISSLYIFPTLLVMIVSEIVGCAVGYLAISIFWKVFMNSMGGWFAYYMDLKDFVRMFVMIFIAYIVVMLIDMRRIKKVPMDEALKNVE